MAYREKDTKKWTAQWFETNVMGEKKKRRKRGFETKREALDFERSKKLSNERSMDMKLSDFIEIYFSDKQNDLKDRTIKNKRYMMQQHIVPYFGNQMMSEIKASQIIQWQNEIQKKGYSDSYLRMIQNQLTSLFTHAAKIYDLPSMQESETNGKFGFEKFELLDTGRVQTVYTDNGAGNKILSYI